MARTQIVTGVVISLSEAFRVRRNVPLAGPGIECIVDSLVEIRSQSSVNDFGTNLYRNPASCA